MIEFHRLCSPSDLLNGEKAGFQFDGHNVLLLKIAGQFYAYEDQCPHQGVPLSQGTLTGTTLTCYAHEWQFNATTGQGINPEVCGLHQLPLKITGTDVMVGWESNL